ncbi:MAG: type I secretion C-terminal target domain-containing protein, partial [Kiloniellales bacterium]|nr:type I secretion C-terminal target domain-containing protein [Kiloniellales bacterium]
GDVLDLDDLLAGANDDAADLLGYLDITFSAAPDTTTIKVDADGGGDDFGSPDLTIVISGVDLSGGGALSEQQVIEDLLMNGNLITN